MAKKKKKKVVDDDIIEPDLLPIVEEEEKSHYVDNKEFLKEMVKWKTKYDSAESSGRKTPPVSSYIRFCSFDF